MVNEVDKTLPPLHKAKTGEEKIRKEIKARGKVKNFFKAKVNYD